MGIDPGALGGIALIDRRGAFIVAHRWMPRDPAKLYRFILTAAPEVRGPVYLEAVHAHPGEGLGFVVRNQSLMVNWGIWQGFLIAAGLSFALIHPATWQTANGLKSWKAKQATNPAAPGPLSLARRLWPTAPLDVAADDGKAVALILADLARRDNLTGIDRNAATAANLVKAKARKKKLREARNAATAANHNAPTTAPGPPRCDDWPPPLPMTQPKTLSPRHRPQAAPKFTFYPD